MARKSLRPQLNQIRAWVRQGRTDAWIAHQLEVTAAQLRDFRKRHDLTDEGEDAADVDLRDAIEAEIEADLDEPEEEEEEDEDEEDEAEEKDEKDDKGKGKAKTKAKAGDAEDEDDEKPAQPRRRRRRRGGRGRGRGRGKGKGGPLEATFDHGEKDGYGLWLDGAVKDDPVYSEHWAGHRAVRVKIEPERIVLERIEDESSEDKDE